MIERLACTLHEVLAFGKGVFGATTIIPDSIGWANCKADFSSHSQLAESLAHVSLSASPSCQKRLGPEGLQYFESEAGP